MAVKQGIMGWDDAPLCAAVDTHGKKHIMSKMLLKRAQSLSESYCKFGEHKALQKTPKYKTVDLSTFTDALENTNPPDLTDITREVVTGKVTEGCSVLENKARECKMRVFRGERSWDETQPRWKRLLESNDSKTIWKAINWSGKVNTNEHEQPEDEQFRAHLEQLLTEGRVSEETQQLEFESSPSIPVLDNPCTLQQLDETVKDVNVNKSYLGIYPGLIKVLPVNWFMF